MYFYFYVYIFLLLCMFRSVYSVFIVLFYVSFVCKCVLYYYHRVSTQLQLTDISYHIISYHIISYHIISYHIISYHIISYHIISYHIISYHISYHILSYHIISYHHTISDPTRTGLGSNPELLCNRLVATCCDVTA